MAVNYLEEKYAGDSADFGRKIAAYVPLWEGAIRDGFERFKTGYDKPPFSDYIDRPFDFDSFYSFFPEFEPAGGDENAAYSRKFLAAVAKQAAFFVRPSQCRELDGADRYYAFMLTVAHMLVLIKREQTGLVGTATPGSGAMATMDVMPGVMTSASVGGVSVSKTGTYQPRNMWESWYYETPYGRRFLVFLEQQVGAGLLYEGEENIADCLRE